VIKNISLSGFGGEMFLIVFYDIKTGKRSPKVLKYLRRQLVWVQNSVFEGEVTELQLKQIKDTLEGLINKEKDSVIIYSFASMQYSKRTVIGIEKNSTDGFI